MADYRTPSTRDQALVEALYLALIAQGEQEAQACSELAEELAVGLDESTVEKAKAYALERYEVEIAAKP